MRRLLAHCLDDLVRSSTSESLPFTRLRFNFSQIVWLCLIRNSIHFLSSWDLTRSRFQIGMRLRVDWAKKAPFLGIHWAWLLKLTLNAILCLNVCCIWPTHHWRILPFSKVVMIDSLYAFLTLHEVLLEVFQDATVLMLLNHLIVESTLLRAFIDCPFFKEESVWQARLVSWPQSFGHDTFKIIRSLVCAQYCRHLIELFRVYRVVVRAIHAWVLVLVSLDAVHDALLVHIPQRGVELRQANTIKLLLKSCFVVLNSSSVDRHLQLRIKSVKGALITKIGHLQFERFVIYACSNLPLCEGLSVIHLCLFVVC